MDIAASMVDAHAARIDRYGLGGDADLRREPLMVPPKPCQDNGPVGRSSHTLGVVGQLDRASAVDGATLLPGRSSAGTGR
jgi:hypothetical protein